MSDNKEIEIGYNLMLLLVVFCVTSCIAFIVFVGLNYSKSADPIQAASNAEYGKIALVGDSLFVHGKYSGKVIRLGGIIDRIPPVDTSLTVDRYGRITDYYNKKTE